MIGLLWLALAQEGLPEEAPILAEIEGYDAQITTLDGQIGALGAQVEERAGALAARAAEAAEAKGRMDAEREPTRAQLRSYYTLQRRGVARLLFSAESPAELRRRVRYLLGILRALESRQRDWRELIASAAAAESSAAQEGEALDALRRELETRRAQLKVERDRRVQLLRAVRASRPRAAQALTEVRAAQADLGRSIRITEGSLPESAGAGQTAAFRAARGRMRMPVAGSVLRGFGSFVDPASGVQVDNLGVDIGAPLGAPFRAVADGTVTRSGYTRGYGQMVVVQHGAYTTLYAHANGLRVAQGQEVQAGDVLGLVGTTGLVDDQHPRLHFEVRYNGTPQDPMEWLGG